MTTDLTTLQERFEQALDAGDIAAADAVLLSVPDELREPFDTWVASLVPERDAEDLPEPTQLERERSMLARGIDAQDAALLATLTSGNVPASVLVEDAMRARALDAEQVGEALVAELEIPADVEQARPRIARAIRNVITGSDGQAGRFAPDAVDALARVLGGQIDAFRRAFEAATPSGSFAGALAREGRDDVLLPDDLAAEDDDIIDELFYRSEY